MEEVQRIAAALMELKTVMNESERKKLYDMQSEVEREVNRIYHEIEMSHANACDGWKYYKRLQEALIHRRNVKDAIYLFENLKIGNSYLDVQIEKVFKRMEDRPWSPRNDLHPQNETNEE